MTNKERLLSLLAFAPENNALDGELLDAGINGSDTYTSARSLDIKKMAIRLMQLLLTTADTRNENGYLIEFDRNAVLDRIKLLKSELGLEDNSMPVITSRKVW